jgi:transposase
MPTPHAFPITINDADWLTLQRWASRLETAPTLALRARIVLAVARGSATHTEIAERLGTHRHTVAKWRRRYAARGLDGLADEPRPVAPRRITEARVAQVLEVAREQAPPNGTHWSTRQLARRLGVSQSAVYRIWRAFGVQPPRAETSPRPRTTRRADGTIR